MHSVIPLKNNALYFFVRKKRRFSIVRVRKFEKKKGNSPQKSVHHIWNHISISYRCRLCVLIVFLNDIDGRDSLPFHFQKLHDDFFLSKSKKICEESFAESLSPHVRLQRSSNAAEFIQQHDDDGKNSIRLDLKSLYIFSALSRSEGRGGLSAEKLDKKQQQQ